MHGYEIEQKRIPAFVGVSRGNISGKSEFIPAFPPNNLSLFQLLNDKISNSFICVR
jgi:hypothetical protein